MKILFSLATLLFCFSVVFPCTCVNPNVSESEKAKYLKNYKAIFYGKVLSIGEIRTIERTSDPASGFWDGYRPVKFRVLRAWKGIEDSEIVVQADLESSCAYPLAVNDEVLIYVFKSEKPKIEFAMNYCSVNHFDNNFMKQTYGEGKVFEETPLQTSQQPPPFEGFWSGLWQKILSFFS